MREDTIKFEREIVKWGNEEKEMICAKIIINDTPLIETVRAYELPFAKKYNHENIAGGYIYNYAEYLHKLLTGEQTSQEYENEIPILICQCGCEGCWDFLVTIKESETSVTWTSFHNPRRSSPNSPGGFWDYGNLSSFYFDKTQYLEAINTLNEINK